jgi:precorrin-6B methylase 2
LDWLLASAAGVDLPFVELHDDGVVGIDAHVRKPLSREAAIEALRKGGRLVTNAVTLEMEALLLAQHTKLGGDLARIAISRASPVGSMQAWRPAMPVTQWSWVKP